MSASREPDEAVSAREAARRLGIGSVNTVKRWVREGRLDGSWVGGQVLIPSRSLRRLLDAGDQELRHLQAEHARIDRLRAADDIDIDPSDPDVRQILERDHPR